MTFSLSITGTSRDGLTSEATVEVLGTAQAQDVITAGLAALHRPRAGLRDYGIRGPVSDRDTVKDATVVVYAHEEGP